MGGLEKTAQRTKSEKKIEKSSLFVTFMIPDNKETRRNFTVRGRESWIWHLVWDKAAFVPFGFTGPLYMTGEVKRVTTKATERYERDSQ